MVDTEENIREENHKNIIKSSDRKILRKQMELLAEYSRLPYAHKKIPEASMAMVSIYRELFKTKCFNIALFSVFFIILFSALYGRFFNAIFRKD